MSKIYKLRNVGLNYLTYRFKILSSISKPKTKRKKETQAYSKEKTYMGLVSKPK